MLSPKQFLQKGLRKVFGIEIQSSGKPQPATSLPDIKRDRWKDVSANDPKHYLTIGAIFKDEAPYLQEWIEFHLMQGVEKIFLYNHMSVDNFMPVLMPYIREGLVEVRTWKKPAYPGSTTQYEAYQSCVETRGPYAHWMAFIDIDEFLFPVEENVTLSEVLRRYEEHPAVAVHWKVFSTSGHVLTPPGLTIENFTKSDPIISPMVKLIINTEQIKRFDTAHSAQFLNDRVAVTENFDPITMPSRYPPSSQVLRLNHYWTKSVEEFAQKNARGNVGGGDNKYNVGLLLHREHFDTEHDTLIQRYLPELKARLQARSTDK